MGTAVSIVVERGAKTGGPWRTPEKQLPKTLPADSDEIAAGGRLPPMDRS
jgi:hypothetical protein